MVDEKYINFPIQLLNDFIVDDNKCLNNIMDYGCYQHSLKLEHGTPIEAFKSASHYFGISIGNLNKSFKNGHQLHDSIPENSPKVGISLTILWDYYKNHKTEFEKLCLLGFLAIKSIIQNKAYCKITNDYWISRMDGKCTVFNGFFGLSEQLLKYKKEYWFRKIKTELILNWGLKHYSRHTRGFYVSFKLSLEDLVFEAEKRRKSTKEKQLKKDIEDAIAKAKKRLENE